MEQKNKSFQSRFQSFLNTCQDELKKTTSIGKSMINASKTNSQLREAYEELGRLVFKALEENTLNWDNTAAKDYVEKIKKYQVEMENLENEVQYIKEEAKEETKKGESKETL